MNCLWNQNMAFEDMFGNRYKHLYIYSGVSLTQQSVILTMTLPVLNLPVSVREPCSLGSHQVQDLLSRK